MASNDSSQDFVLHKLQQGWRSWLGVKSDFLDWYCQTNGGFDPMPLPHLHWRFPWTCLLCGAAEAQKGWDIVRAGCRQGVPLSTAEQNEKEGPRDVDEWTRIAGALSQSLVGQCPLVSPSKVMRFLAYEAQGDCFLDFLGEVGIMYESCPTRSTFSSLGKITNNGWQVFAGPSYWSVGHQHGGTLPCRLAKATDQCTVKLLDVEQERVYFPAGFLPVPGNDEHSWGRTACPRVPAMLLSTRHSTHIPNLT